MNLNMRKFLIMAQLMAMVVLGSACADKKADFERAKYLVGRGGQADGEKAADLVEPYLTDSDLQTRMEAVVIYGGAKIAEAGVSARQIIVNMIEGDGDDTVSNLADALSNVPTQEDDDGFERARRARRIIEEAFTQYQALIATEAFNNITAATSEGGFRDRLGVFYGYGMALLVHSLIIGVVDSGFLLSNDINDICDGQLTEDLATIMIDNIRRARVQFINARLDDRQQVLQIRDGGDTGDLDSQLTAADLEASDDNNILNKLLEDIQSEVDGNRDGTAGTTDFDSALDEVCAYLETQG